MTYLQALQKLQYWLTNNQTSHANHLNFDAYPLSADELQQAIACILTNRVCGYSIHPIYGQHKL